MVAVVSILVFDAIVIGGYGSYKVIKNFKKKRALRKEKLRKEKLYKKYIKRTTEVKETSKKSNEICVICQDDFKEDNECSKLYCGHNFHPECIKEWISHKKTCPLCNTKLQKRRKKQTKEDILLELAQLYSKPKLGLLYSDQIVKLEEKLKQLNNN